MNDARFRHCFVASIPEDLVDGAVYISLAHRIAVHLCACGCGHEVVMPFGGSLWALRWTNGSVTFEPSVGNVSLPCRSHYYMRNGLIEWLPSLNDDARSTTGTRIRRR